MFTNTNTNKKTAFAAVSNTITSYNRKTAFATATGANIEYEKLNTISDALNMYLDTYVNDNVILLDNAKYLEISIILNDSAKDPQKYPEYEQLRIHLKQVLEAIFIAKRNLADTYSLTRDLSNCANNMEQYAKILESVDSANEYFRSLTKRLGNPFPESEITVMKAEILPIYRLYISRYGYPSNGVFDADKLAIVNSLL